MMKGSFPHRLAAPRQVAFLALVIALRSLVPIGFMPVVDHTGIHFGFCPGEAQPPGARLGQHHEHHQHGAGNHDPSGSTSHAPCLFALSGSPALVPVMPSVAPLPPAIAARTVTLSSRVSVPAIVRAQTPRGPPSHA